MLRGMHTQLRLALLASTLAISSASSGEIQLLPFGKFSARDGRPGVGKQWSIDDAAGERIAAQLNGIAAQTPIVIDYEHQTFYAEKNGQPAPAAGWMNRFEWRKGAGLFSSVEWTPRAKAFIEGNEYRYISPVIEFNDDTGAIRGVALAGLVNFPALLGMEPVFAQLRAFSGSQSQDQEQSMNLLAQLVALFGLAAATTDDQIVAHLTTLKAVSDNSAQQLAALRTSLGLDDKADLAACAAQVATLKAATGKPDPAMQAIVTGLQTQLATLRGEIDSRELDDVVDGAIKDGKFPPAQRQHLIDLGKKDKAWLKTFVEQSPVITAALGAGQSGGDGSRGKKDGELDDTQLAVCKAMGLTVEQFKAGASA